MIQHYPPSIHAGHRSRMRHRFLVNGLNGFSDHEVLELLLFYAVPRRDVNPMAHALLNRFGSLPAVLSASEEDLCTIYGVGPKIADFLRLIPDILIQTNYYLLHPTRTVLRTAADVTAMMAHRYNPPVLGDIYVILLDPGYAFTYLYPIASFEELSVRELILCCLEWSCKRVVLTECVEDSIDPPSDTRLQQLIMLQSTLAPLDICLVDHYRFDPAFTQTRSAAKEGYLLPR